MSRTIMDKRIAYIRSSGIFDDSRATKEIRALSSHGYEIIVIGWDRSGFGEKKCKEIFDSPNIEFVFFHEIVTGGIGKKGIKKLIGYFEFVKRELIRRKDSLFAVHACDLDGSLGAYRFCKKNNIPLVYDIYDYYIDSHSIPRLLMNTVERMEINVINQAACTIICTEERRAQIEKSKPKDIRVIYNSPDIEENDDRISDIKYDYVYCGAFEERRLIEEILDNYEQHRQFRFVFAGSGKYDEKAKEIANYPNFSFLGRISYDTVIEIEKQSLVISAIYEPTVRNHVLCAPNKFYEALALGKPVIVCKGTGIDKVVAQHRIGRVIEYSADQFYEALESLLQDKNELENISVRAKKLYQTTYRWKLMEERLCLIYDNIVENMNG